MHDTRARAHTHTHAQIRTNIRMYNMLSILMLIFISNPLLVNQIATQFYLRGRVRPMPDVLHFKYVEVPWAEHSVNDAVQSKAIISAIFVILVYVYFTFGVIYFAVGFCPQLLHCSRFSPNSSRNAFIYV